MARNPREADKLLGEIRAAGFATMHEAYSEREYGGRFKSVGTAIHVNAQYVAAIDIMLMPEIADADEGVIRFVSPLRHAANKIEAALK